jgi:hypothetical protein
MRGYAHVFSGQDCPSVYVRYSLRLWRSIRKDVIIVVVATAVDTRRCRVLIDAVLIILLLLRITVATGAIGILLSVGEARLGRIHLGTCRLGLSCL